MKIKEILDEIANESSTNKKKEILSKYSDNELFKRVLYLAKSKRIKFYIKQIPEYENSPTVNLNLETELNNLSKFSDRELTGNAARDYLKEMLEYLSPDDAYVIERIIEKDLKIGVATSLINKVYKDLIETTPYQGAKSYNDKKVRDLIDNNEFALSQIKMDGRYCNAIIQGGDVDLVSRQGETTHVGDAPFLKELTELDDCVLNGELTIDGFSRYEANGMVTSIIDVESKRGVRTEKETQKHIDKFEKGHGSYEDAISKIRLTVWDMITIDEYFNLKSDTEYLNRLSSLEAIIEDFIMVSIVETEMVYNYEEAIEHFLKILGMGLEGTILKSPTHGWKNGKGYHQIKMKIDMDIDLKIVGFKMGTKGTKNENVVSTLIVESSCGLLKTNPAGMKEDMMEYITTNQEELLGTIVEIRCCGLSQDHEGNWSTLHPSVVKLRDDKDTCDSLESAQEIEAMAKGLKIA
jgi:DNA ligase-1